MRKIRARAAVIGLAAVVTWAATSLASSPSEVEFAEPQMEAVDPEDERTIDETEPDSLESDQDSHADEPSFAPPSMPAGPPKPPSPDEPTDNKDKDGCECGVIGVRSESQSWSGGLWVFALLALGRRRARHRIR